jgi:hypothetical protein
VYDPCAITLRRAAPRVGENSAQRVEGEDGRFSANRDHALWPQRRRALKVPSIQYEIFGTHVLVFVIERIASYEDAQVALKRQASSQASNAAYCASKEGPKPFFFSK